MGKGLWKKGWFWGVVGAILILTVPQLVLALLGVEPNGKSSDGRNVRVWAIGFFFAHNHVEIHDQAPAKPDEKQDREVKPDD